MSPDKALADFLWLSRHDEQCDSDLATTIS
jgi:hypothetical protein